MRKANPRAKQEAPTEAVIYARVSSIKQMTEGDGINSQIRTCEDFAAGLNLKVLKSFKDGAVSGATASRKGFDSMLAFVAAHPKRLAIIVYDVDRLSRDAFVWFDFEKKLDELNALILSPRHNFDKTASGKLVTGMKVVTAAFFRDENRERVCSRQKARMLDGYCAWGHAAGYQWIKDPARGGKILKINDPAASAIRELFEGYAAGRFETVADAAKFLEIDGRIPTDKKGRVYPSRAKAILINLVYTGYLKHLPWGIPLTRAKHEAIISLDTYHRVQERLGYKPKAKYRKDLNVDFPLRGFVLCAACDKPLTASWSTARNGQKHPYYSCKTKGCAAYGKSLKRGKVEGDFEGVLHTIKPSQAIIELARAITVDIHREKYATFQRATQQREAKEKAMEAKLASLTDKLINTSNPSVEQAIEREIERLENERRIIEEQSRQSAAVDTSLEDALGTVFDFIGNPYGIWTSKDLEDKRLVLKLAFAKQLPYSKTEGFGTALTSLPFSIISSLSMSEKGMVGDAGFEPATY